MEHTNKRYTEAGRRTRRQSQEQPAGPRRGAGGVSGLGSLSVVEDASEKALRILAAGLALLLLLGAAACGDEVPDLSANVSPEVVAAAAPTPTEALPHSEVEAPAEGVTASTPPSEARELPSSVSYAMAEEAYHRGSYSEAVDLFEAYTLDKPENPWGFYMLGLSAWKAGYLEVAEANLGQSVAMDPNHVKGHVNLARVFLDMGRVDEALQHATIADDIDPASSPAKRTLARALSEAGQVEEALDMYEAVLHGDNDDVWALNNMGYLLLQQGRFTEALGPLALAVTLEEENGTFQNNLGHALEGAGHSQTALATFRQLVALQPDHERGQTSLARLEAIQPTEEGAVDIVAIGEEFRARVRGTLALEEALIPSADSIPPTN